MYFDGIQFFKDFHIRYSSSGPNVSQGWVGISCPFCNDRSDHLGFHLKTGAMTCWKCGTHSAFEYVKTVLKIPSSEARIVYPRYLSKGTNNLFNKVSGEFTKGAIILPDPVFTVPEQNYLKKRDIDDEQIKAYDLRGGGLVGKWAHRIVIPVIYNGAIVAASGRSIANVEPKYHNLPLKESLMNMKHLFLGLDVVPNSTVAIVEGQIDAIRGGPGFLASFGVALSDEQLLILMEYDTIHFVCDNDAAGDRYKAEAYRLAALGHNDVNVCVIDKRYKDVGEMPRQEIQGVRVELGI